MKFVKRPIVVDATQWFKNGDHPLDHTAVNLFISKQYQKDNDWEGQIVRRYRHPNVSGETQCKHCNNRMHIHGWIDTLEGGHIVCPGDWIITGVNREHYPCKPDIFEKTYEPFKG